MIPIVGGFKRLNIGLTLGPSSDNITFGRETIHSGESHNIALMTFSFSLSHMI